MTLFQGGSSRANETRLALLLVALALPASAVAQAMFSPFVPTREDIAARMIDLAALRKGERVVDLGSGDGRLVIWSAKANPGVTGFGVDIDAKLVREASARAWMEGVGERVSFHHQNAFDADLRKVDVIYMWLFPELQRLLRDKILREARPGTRVLSHLFDLGAWQPDAIDKAQPGVRMWVVPANVAGYWNWELELPGSKRNRYVAIISQVFQNADAVVRVGNARRAVREFKVNGETLSFSLFMPLPGLAVAWEHEFSGRVKGDRIEGKVRMHRPVRGESEESDAVEHPWRAFRSAKTTYFAPTGVEMRQ